MAETSKKKSAKEIYEGLVAELNEIDYNEDKEKYIAKAKEMRKASKTYLSEKVKIKLPRARGGESKYVVVGSEGKIYRIERGVEVEVPREIAMIHEISEIQKDAAYEHMEALADEYERSK